jgi:hypothetical protein
MRRQYPDNGKTPSKATLNQVDRLEAGSTMPRAVVAVPSHLATQWIILANLFILMRLFYGSGVAADAMRCSVSVCTATAGSVIAAPSAASWHAGNNGGAPIAATSKALKDDWIIATGSASIAIAADESGPE